MRRPSASREQHFPHRLRLIQVETLERVDVPNPLTSTEEGLEPDRASVALAKPVETSAGSSRAAPTHAAAVGIPEFRAPLRAHERIVKPSKWEKANVTLEPRDRNSRTGGSQARSYGFRTRKGGNPSLFIRAGLRLLDELGERDPEAWIKRIAAITSTGNELTK